MGKPLVSIMVPTCNDARTLKRCLQSVLEQDYENLRVVGLDNRSTDDSYDILVDFEKRHRDRLYTGRLHDRVSPTDHRDRCLLLTNPRTLFIQYLPATDVLQPTYVSHVMEMIESSKQIGCVMTHADILQPDGTQLNAPKFQPQSSVLPGVAQMQAFMSQGLELNTVELFRIEAYELSKREGFIFNRFPNWLPLLAAASIYDIGYVSEPLALRGDPRTILGDRHVPTLEDQFEHYLFLQAFQTIATRLGRTRVAAGLPGAIRRLALHCARSAGQLARDGRESQAYRSLALAYQPELAQDPEFLQLTQACKATAQDGR